MKVFKFFSVAVAMILLSLSVQAQKIITDDSYQDDSFLKFKMKLTNAVLDRDTTQLFALVDNAIFLDGERIEGESDFKNIFRRELYDHNSDFDPWKQLKEIMSFGFRRNVITDEVNFWGAKTGETVFQAPSYQKFIAGNEDIYLFVVAEHVNVREKPTIYSKKISSVSHEKLLYEFPDSGVSPIFNDGYNWLKVKLRGGQEGYIVDEFTSLKIMKELSVKKVNGEWKIISFFTPSGC